MSTKYYVTFEAKVNAGEGDEHWERATVEVIGPEAAHDLQNKLEVYGRASEKDCLANLFLNFEDQIFPGGIRNVFVSHHPPTTNIEWKPLKKTE